MSDLEATLTSLNNTINNTITDYTPVFGSLDEKSQLVDGVEIQVIFLIRHFFIALNLISLLLCYICANCHTLIICTIT